jgi:hypothetical protein
VSTSLMTDPVPKSIRVVLLTDAWISRGEDTPPSATNAEAYL